MSFFKDGGISGVLKTEDYMQGAFLVCRKDRSQKGLGTELMRRYSDSLIISVYICTETRT